MHQVYCGETIDSLRLSTTFFKRIKHYIIPFSSDGRILTFNDYSMLPLASVSNMVVIEIVFSFPIVPTYLLEFKVIFCDETPG